MKGPSGMGRGGGGAQDALFYRSGGGWRREIECGGRVGAAARIAEVESVRRQELQRLLRVPEKTMREWRGETVRMGTVGYGAFNA